MHKLVSEARKYATEVHRRIDQRRKYTNQPYEVHLKTVAQIVTTVSDDPEMIAAAWLHDTVEDTPATIEEIEAVFGTNVALLVRELTDVSRPGDGNRSVRKAIDRTHIANASARAQTIKLADLIDNCQDICREDPKFAIVFCSEMEALLAVLNKGDERLHRRAEKVLLQCRSRLDNESDFVPQPDELSPFERHSISEHQRALRTFARTFTAADIAEPLRSFDAVNPVQEGAELKEEKDSGYNMDKNGVFFEKYDKKGNVIFRIPSEKKPVDKHV
ncbi:metal dependent phosphohydrolase [Desulfosarcina variabilis str. Montpellier]|uniref:HD domain-containing protein n=1 Tax=Desulfosarcina variabilis TaxID=2300 RepID=UPI003AFB50C2